MTRHSTSLDGAGQGWRVNAQPTASTLDGVSQSQRLALVLGLNLALVAALVIVGVGTVTLLGAGHRHPAT
jgi:hypothetical protein